MIITPRKYFSYSQYSSFHYSKERFLKQYYYGEEQESCYLDLGKRLGTALQFRDKKEIPVINKIRKQIPEADIYEYEIKTTFKQIPLLCYLDGFSKKDYEVMEFKTGKLSSEKSWREQQLFYALALYMKHKKLPNKTTLYWAKTLFNENDQLVLTGDVKKYDIKITMNDVIQFSDDLVKTYRDIVKVCEEEYQQFGILPAKRSANGRNNHNNKLKK